MNVKMAMEVVNLNTKVLEVKVEEEIANLCLKKYVVKLQCLIVAKLLIQHAGKHPRVYVERFRENSATRSRDITASRSDNKLL